MPAMEPTNKLSSEQEEYRICAKPYVFYRIILDRTGARLMTATAHEDSGEYKAFEDQEALLAATAQILGDYEMGFLRKKDHAGRPYLETRVSPDAQHLIHVATTALDQMNFEDVLVLALREMKALHEEFAIDDGGGDVYLSDGMWVTADGRVVER